MYLPEIHMKVNEWYIKKLLFFNRVIVNYVVNHSSSDNDYNFSVNISNEKQRNVSYLVIRNRI